MPVLPPHKAWSVACTKAWKSTPKWMPLAKTPRPKLQEWLQSRRMKLPQYRVVATLGMAHKQTFDVECDIIELGLTERGIGGSRRAGEQAAALAMLQTVKTKIKNKS
jgi:ribonuclease-3